MSGWADAYLFGGLIGMLIVDPITGAMYKLTPDTLDASLDAEELKSSFKANGSLTIVLAENVPVALWKHAQLIQPN